MTRLSASLLVLVLMAACGADGPPEPPTRAVQQDGIRMSGEARIGIQTNID